MRLRCLFASVLVFSLAALPGFAPAASAPAPATPPPPEAPLTAFYAVGASFARSSRIPELGWTPAQLDAFTAGVRATFGGESIPFDAEAQRLFALLDAHINALESLDRQRAFAQPGRMAEYMKDVRKKFTLTESDSGLAFSIQRSNQSLRPGPEDTVVITLTATAADTTTDLKHLGVNRARIKVQDMIPGLAELVQMMTIDSQAMAVLPPDLSYGDGPWPEGTDRGTPLLFILKLHEVIAAP